MLANKRKNADRREIYQKFPILRTRTQDRGKNRRLVITVVGMGIEIIVRINAVGSSGIRTTPGRRGNGIRVGCRVNITVLRANVRGERGHDPQSRYRSQTDLQHFFFRSFSRFIFDKIFQFLV